MAHWTKEVEYSALSSTAVPDQIIDLQLWVGSGDYRDEITWSLLHELKRLHFYISVFEIWHTFIPHEVKDWKSSLMCCDRMNRCKHAGFGVSGCVPFEFVTRESVCTHNCSHAAERGWERGREWGKPEYSCWLWKGGHLIPKPSLFPLISEKRHHNPVEGFTSICSMEISKERGREKREMEVGTKSVQYGGGDGQKIQTPQEEWTK